MNSHPSSTDTFLSFCIIAKNEQQHLPRCLISVQPYVDEIVVVDTGSEDNTIALALQYGAKIEYFTWCDDFAAARNFAIAQASGDWILMLDADEELVVESANWREQLFVEPQILAYWLNLIETSQPLTPLRTLRLFRNLPDLRYSGRYHEQLKYQGQLIDDALVRDCPNLKILHYGYEEKLLLQKNSDRDIPMLERIRQQEDMSLLLLMTLASAYLRTDQLEKAQECWAEAFDLITPNLLTGDIPTETTRLSALVFTLASDALLSRQDYETTLMLCRRGLEWFPNYPPLSHLTGLALKELGFLVGAAAYFENCLQMGWEETYDRRESFDSQFLTIRPACDLGQVYLELQRWPQAVEAFELALAFDANCEAAQVGLEAAKSLNH